MSPGRALARLSVLPALALTGWLLVALPLLLAGWLRPLPAALAAIPAAGFAVRLGWRATAAGRLGTQSNQVPAWALLAVVAIAVASTVTNGVLRSEQLILRRDAASYAQIGHWLAEHGRLPIPVHLDAFGGPDPAFGLESGAFYADGGSVVPQFMSGLPMTLAGAEWLTSWTAALWLATILGGFALLAFGGLAARLVGPRWAVPATLFLAVTLPFWHTTRSAYSEPFALLLLIGGLCLLVDALHGTETETPHPAARLGALLAGLMIGISALVRVDAVREITLLVPVVGWLWLRRRPLAVPLAAGLGIGFGYGLVDALVLTRPYVVQIAGSLLPLLALLVVAVAATVVVVRQVGRRGWVPSARFGTVAAAVTVATGVLFAIRPWLQTVHGSRPGSPVATFMARLQLREGLPIDGTRTYDEASLHWLSWWVGWPTIVLAIGAAAVLLRRVLAGRDQAWIPVVAIGLGATALTLLRPGITPDHPWADRRFVPVVLPLIVLFATYAVAELTYRQRRAARASPAPRRTGALVAVIGVAAMLVPAILASVPLAGKRTELGTVAAIRDLCANLRPNDAVLLTDNRIRSEWGPIVRGECGVPAVGIRDRDPATVQRLVDRIRSAGHDPVLLSAESAELLQAAGAVPRKIVDLRLVIDPRTLTRRPDTNLSERFQVWIGRP